MTEDVTTMHLKLLFDLDNLLSDLDAPVYKKLGFKIKPQERSALLQTREDLLKKLPPEMATIYERLRERYQRAIAPVENGFCFGCFQKLPTELLTRSKEINMCPNCGRILYWRIK